MDFIRSFAVVLTSEQRAAKRQLIEDNRHKRALMNIRNQLNAAPAVSPMNEDDRQLLHCIAHAHCTLFDAQLEPLQLSKLHSMAPELAWQQVVAPFVKRAVQFANQLPGFDTVNL